ncbi:unnamed protein product [Ambrosiozyma monospora]|uniref:Unnamed protein product n=1 Tax=Ambrosiozyma monospora TaxID=43982 RepID=A0ACB5U6J7_AMBMO|nr:unnamed protein product [Ambrosiozyma monospora]
MDNTMFGMSIRSSIPQLELSVKFMDEESQCDAICINTDGQNGDTSPNSDAESGSSHALVSGYRYLFGKSSLLSKRARIDICESTKLDVLLFDVNEDVLVYCDDDVLHNVDCYVNGSFKSFEKYDGDGVSILTNSDLDSSRRKRIGGGVCTIV